MRADNSQGEYYLGDVLPLLRAAGHRVVAHLTDDEAVGLGINTRADLARVEAAARARILEQHMLAGVTIRDPASTLIDADVAIGEDTAIEPYSFLRGAVERRARLHDRADDHADRLARSATTSSVPTPICTPARSRAGCTVGPFTHLRPRRGLGRARRPARSSRSRTPTSGRA